MSDVITFPLGIYWPDVIACGCSGIVGRLNAVIKFPHGGNQSHINTEQKIYERLGNGHNRILTYYGALGNGIVLEYASNGCITGYMGMENPEPSLRARWIQQIVEAVSFIHSKDIIHCDIHCNNIFLDSDLNAKLGDFAGSSIDDSKPLGCYSVRHDHPSMSGLSVKREIFALGSTIHHILTGSPPYKDLRDAEIKRRYVRGEYPEVVSLGYLGNVILKCWLMEYKSAEDLLKDLNPQAIDTPESKTSPP